MIVEVLTARDLNRNPFVICENYHSLNSEQYQQQCSDLFGDNYDPSRARTAVSRGIKQCLLSASVLTNNPTATDIA